MRLKHFVGPCLVFVSTALAAAILVAGGVAEVSSFPVLSLIAVGVLLSAAVVRHPDL